MKTIVTLSHFPVLPPTFGGAIRIYNLYLHLKGKYKFHHYCVSLKSPFVKKSSFHGFSVNYMFFPFYSIVAFPFWLMHIPYGFIFRYTFLLGKLPKELDNILSSSDLIITEHPHLFKWVHKRYPNKLFILNSHNVEYELEKQNFKSCSPLLKKIVKNAIKNMESYAVRNADKITTVSELDKKTLINLYKINKNIVTVIPNGCNLIQKLNKDELKKLRKRLMEESGFNFDKLILFIGSDYKPNKEALDNIKKIAKEKYDMSVLFLIVGKVGDKKFNTVNNNIYYTGLVEDINPYLQIADIAINPMVSGSGTNIKMLDYLSAGLPTISTAKGIRGLVDIKKYVLVCELNKFPDKIIYLLKNYSARNTLSHNGITFIEKHFLWKNSALKLDSVIKELLYENKK